MLHFQEKRLYHIADAIAPPGGELYGSDPLVAATAELCKCPSKGNASELPPRVAHSGDADPTGRTDDGDRIASLRLKIIGSVAVDHLMALRPSVKHRDIALFQANLGLYALEALQDAAPGAVFP